MFVYLLILGIRDFVPAFDQRTPHNQGYEVFSDLWCKAARWIYTNPQLKFINAQGVFVKVKKGTLFYKSCFILRFSFLITDITLSFVKLDICCRYTSRIFSYFLQNLVSRPFFQVWYDTDNQLYIEDLNSIQNCSTHFIKIFLNYYTAL